MTLSEYLEEHHAEARTWPGGETTWKLLVGFAQGLGSVAVMGFKKQDVLGSCETVLQQILDEQMDQTLRHEVGHLLLQVRLQLAPPPEPNR